MVKKNNLTKEEQKIVKEARIIDKYIKDNPESWRKIKREARKKKLTFNLDSTIIFKIFILITLIGLSYLFIKVVIMIILGFAPFIVSWVKLYPLIDDVGMKFLGGFCLITIFWYVYLQIINVFEIVAGFLIKAFKE